jgi:C4-dicarboxylate-specific signal transduction histidine kinase
MFLDLADLRRAQGEHERLRQLESDLAHLNRMGMMGELAGSLAHEITQPIAAARNNAQAALNFLNKSQPGLDQVVEALACVVDDVDRAGAIIDRIRDQIKKAPPRTTRFDLNDSVREVIRLGRRAIEMNDISVCIQLADGPRHFHGDRVQLQQVILNLILNAIEAMGTLDDGLRELLISIESGKSGEVIIAVRDSGPGIDPERREQIFDACFTTKPDGIGMGLSICRTIVNAHGGRLWTDANQPRGAVFKIALPNIEACL